MLKDSVAIHAALNRPLDAAQLAALDAAASRHANFLGLPGAVLTTEGPSA